MDPRTPSEVEATGTLPVGGEGSVPLTEEEQAAPAPARPDWVDEARSGLTVPGKMDGEDLTVPPGAFDAVRTYELNSYQ